MIRLINRQRQIPNGMSFYLPQTKWMPRPNSSFQGITEALYHHLRANPDVATQLGWPMDLNFIADKVDEFNAKICEINGWNEYITQAAGGRPAEPFRGNPSAPAWTSQPTCCGGKYHR